MAKKRNRNINKKQNKRQKRNYTDSYISKFSNDVSTFLEEEGRESAYVSRYITSCPGFSISSSHYTTVSSSNQNHNIGMRKIEDLEPEALRLTLDFPLQTKEDIEAIFSYWKIHRLCITSGYLALLRLKLPTNLHSYFDNRIYQLQKELKEMQYSQRIKKSNNHYSEYKEQKKKKVIPNVKNDIQELFTTPSRPEYMNYSKRKPQYGYARNRYGNIQERDHYLEDNEVNSRLSSLSNYDIEDDNDSLYSSFE